jgi:hypothetical protein
MKRGSVTLKARHKGRTFEMRSVMVILLFSLGNTVQNELAYNKELCINYVPSSYAGAAKSQKLRQTGLLTHMGK